MKDMDIQGIIRAKPRRTTNLEKKSPCPLDRLKRDFRLPVVTNISHGRVLRRPVESAQYLSIKYSKRLSDAGIEPSVGRVGDSYDNALAETVNDRLLGRGHTSPRHVPQIRSRRVCNLEWVV
jgi:hypothetical protein